MITEREWQILRREGRMTGGTFPIGLWRVYWNALLCRPPTEPLTNPDAEEILQRLNKEA